MTTVEIKLNKKPLWYRILVILILFSGFVCIFLVISGSDNVPAENHWIRPILYLLGSAALFILFNVFYRFFPFRFGILGSYKRTSFPDEKPLLIIWRYIEPFGKYHLLPHCTWCVFPSGLGVSILGSGDVFIPLGNIISIENNHRKFWSSRRHLYVLRHNSPELIGDLYFSSLEVFEALQEVMEKQNHPAAGAYKGFFGDKSTENHKNPRNK